MLALSRITGDGLDCQVADAERRRRDRLEGAVAFTGAAAVSPACWPDNVPGRPPRRTPRSPFREVRPIFLGRPRNPRGTELADLSRHADYRLSHVPFSPLCKGFLTGAIGENTTFDSTNSRNIVPRLDARRTNQALVDLLGEMAARKQMTSAQITIAYAGAKAVDRCPSEYSA